MATALRSALRLGTRPGGVGGPLARGALGSTLLTIAKNFLQLATSILLARLLGPAGYGSYAFALSLAKVLGVFSTLGLPGLLIREMAAGDADSEWGRVRALIQWANRTVAIAVALIVASVGVAIVLWPNLNGEFRLTLTFALFFLVLDTFVQLRGAQLMGLRHVVVGQLGLLGVEPAVLLLGVVTLTFGLGTRLDSAVALALTAVGAFAALMMNLLLVRRLAPPALLAADPMQTGRRWLRSAAPFAVMTGLFLVSAQIDLVMLGFLSPRSSVGLYRVAATGATVLPFVLAAVNPVLAPTLARLHTLGDHVKLRRTARIGALVSLLGAAPILMVFLVFGRFLIARVFGVDYVDAWLPLVILSIGQFVNAAAGPVGMLLNMTGHEHDTVWVMGASTAMNVVLNAALIPPFGMMGAAIATAISLVGWNCALALRVRQRFGYFLTPFT